MPMKYWLMKTEPDECSIDDALAAPRHITPWTGVRNYQARNFMRDQMRVGDGVLFYHSSCDEPGIAGLAEVASPAYPHPTQLERSSPYYDPKTKRDDPRWFHRSEEHTSELQSQSNLVCRLLLEKKKKKIRRK